MFLGVAVSNKKEQKKHVRNTACQKLVAHITIRYNGKELLMSVFTKELHLVCEILLEL